MAWIRLDDGYIYHPKFTALSANAFRLWHEGMAYCRKLLTDGLIPREALKSFRYAKAPAITELTTSIGANVAPLWEPHDVGFKVHDYLFWNLCKEKELAQKVKTNKRQREKREREVSRVTTTVTPPVTSAVTSRVFRRDVRDGMERVLSTQEEKEHENALAMRAGDLVNRYAELFNHHRRGARYHSRPALDFPKAQELVRTWTDDARLEKLAVLVLTTDDDWIARTDRGFGIFAVKATWADERLAAWEAEQARTA